MARVNPSNTFWNCKLTAKAYLPANYYLKIDTLGYGMFVASNEKATRHQRVFYPFVRTSGLWYVNAVFTDYARWRQFQNWLFGYLILATDPHHKTMQPITVEVASEDFKKVGYPTSTIDFGNTWDKSAYETNIGFASASDPETMMGNASQYHTAANDDWAWQFDPGGFQANILPAPVPVPLTDNPDDTYDTSDSNRTNNIPPIFAE
jgi:hypothetical protein